MPLERNVGTRKDKRIMLTIRQKGDFSKLTKYLIKAKEVAKFDSVLAKYGQRGIDALSKATPVDTGLTASSCITRLKKAIKVCLEFFTIRMSTVGFVSLEFYSMVMEQEMVDGLKVVII